MSNELEQSAIFILNKRGEASGAGFLIGANLAVTCAHLIDSVGSAPGKTVNIKFFTNSEIRSVVVLSKGWSSPEEDDVAFLFVDNLPSDIIPVRLGPSRDCQGHDFLALGLQVSGDYKVKWPQGKLGGITPVISNRRPVLQIQGNEITRGCSGGPVLDLQTMTVVGMITEYKNDELIRFAYATTTETLKLLLPELKIARSPRYTAEAETDDRTKTGGKLTSVIRSKGPVIFARGEGSKAINAGKKSKIRIVDRPSLSSDTPNEETRLPGDQISISSEDSTIIAEEGSTAINADEEASVSINEISEGLDQDQGGEETSDSKSKISNS